MAWFHRQAKEPLRPDLKQRWEARLRNDPKEQAKSSWTIYRRIFNAWCPSGGFAA